MAQRGTFEAFAEWFAGVERSVKAASKAKPPSVIPPERQAIANAIEYGSGKTEPKPIMRTAQAHAGDSWDEAVQTEMMEKILSGDGKTDFTEELERAAERIRKDIVAAGRTIGCEEEARIIVGFSRGDSADKRAEKPKIDLKEKNAPRRDDGEMLRTAQRQKHIPAVPTGTKGRRLGLPKPLDIKHNPTKPIGSKKRGDGVPATLTPRGNRR